MLNQTHKNSKYGFALPVAVVVSCFIIMIAAAILGIAASSTQKTSGDIDSRQAYLNAKSALDYAARYYEEGDLPSNETIGKENQFVEYMAMKDSGGTTEEGAQVFAEESDVKNYKTYVYSVYNNKDSKLTMTAYAKSSDMTGNRTELTSLSVTYDVGSRGNNFGRKLSTAPANTTNRFYSDDVTVHVKQNPNATDYFVPAIYTWSYYKRDDLGIDWSTVHDVTDLTVDQANKVEHSGKNLDDKSDSNEVRPAGLWSPPGVDFDGPATKMDSEGNDWFSHTFSPSKAGGTKGMVPWFNMIISKQGKNIGNKSAGTQTPELLNIWYFDANDKNIYVEILDTFAYYNDQNWDGKVNLEGRIIAYANAPQTVYYFKMKDENGTINDESLNPTVKIDNNSYTAQYSGYGWWSVRCEKIAGSHKASAQITSPKMKNTVTIASINSGSSNSIMGNSAYIVLEPAVDADGNIIKNQYTGSTFMTEEAAAIHMVDEDYVTIYAKVNNRDKVGSPSISYKVETHNSSAAKIKLKNAIADADQLYQPDYDATSWNDFINVVNEAKKVYNNTTLQSNSKYNDEVNKIANAKKDLKLKEADATKLQQAYDNATDANKYPENKYTEESFEALKIVVEQGKSLLDAFGKDKTSVRQEVLDNKATDINDKISALEEIASYRTNLENAITNAKTVRDNNPDSKLIDQLNQDIATAENLYSNNSRNKTAIQKATKELNNTVERVQNLGDPTALNTRIEEANAIIARDKNILVSGTLSNLQNVITTINNVLANKVLIQSEIDSYLASLNSAISELAYIPKDNTIPEVAAGKKRVWFDIDHNGLGSNGDNYYIYAWEGAGGDGHQNASFDTIRGANENNKAAFKLEKDTVSRYYYYDLEEKYTNVIVVCGVGNDADQSADISVGSKLDNNLFLIGSDYTVKNSSIDWRVYSVSAAKLTTIYSSTDVSATALGGNSAQYIYVKNSKNASLDTASATAEPMQVKDETKHYYVKRVGFDSDSTFHICNGEVITQPISITTEPCVIRFKDKSNPLTSIDAKSLSEFKKLAPHTDIQNMSKSNSANIKNMSIQNLSTATSSVYVDSHIPSNPIITVYFKPNSNIDTFYANLYQRDDTDKTLNKQTNRILMTDDGKNYYITIDTRNTNAIEVYDANTDSITGIIKLAIDSSKNKNKYFTTQQISHSSAGWIMSAYTASAVNISTADVTFDSSCSNKAMAFVGGKKRFFTNKPDERAGRTDAYNRSLSASRPFGGVSNGNDYGNGRVGITDYKIYYDWYEYKIPAGSSDLYTFQIKGLMNTDSQSNVWTKQIHQVWGDVWVSLDNGDVDNGKLKNVSIATANPDDNVTTKTTRIYVTENSSWVSNHGGMKVTMWGTEKKVEKLSKTYDGRYYIDVPNNMPFLQFTSDDDSQVLPMTKLQSGDAILYDYSAGKGGTPAWITYVPAYKALQREITSASSVANGWFIYDYSSPNVVSNSHKPNKLLSMVSGDNSYKPSETADPTSQQNDANTLAQWTTAYKNLYNAVSNARMYITKDSSGNSIWFPEQASNTTGVSYSQDSLKTLYDKMVEAINEYDNSNASLSKLISLAEELETLEDQLVPNTDNSAILILDDTKGWKSNVFVNYTDNSGTHKLPVTSRNRDGYLMLYVNIASGSEIKGVYFSSNGETSATKDVIKSGSVWVCDNSESGVKAWVANTPENYFVYSIKNYKQTASSKEAIVGVEFSKSSSFIVYFNYETTVTYNSNGTEKTYKILPGAYVINKTAYQKNDTDINNSNSKKVNLYSDVAKTYFEDIANQGYVKGAPFSDDIGTGWTTNGKIVQHPGVIYNSTSSINFAASSGELNGSYKSMNKLVFRWLSTNKLNVENNTSMNAKEFVFASTATVYGGNTISPKFTLKNNVDGKPDKVKITFLTDVTVSYKDKTGAKVSFVISQGTYESIKAEEYNLFDSNWSKNFKSVGNGISGSDGDNKYLTNPVYRLN